MDIKSILTNVQHVVLFFKRHFCNITDLRLQMFLVYLGYSLYIHVLEQFYSNIDVF